MTRRVHASIGATYLETTEVGNGTVHQLCNLFGVFNICLRGSDVRPVSQALGLVDDLCSKTNADEKMCGDLGATLRGLQGYS